MNEVTAKSPAECTATEVEDFASLVLAGGEVGSQGLIGRVAKAEGLGFLRRQGCLVGVAGLKKPEASYRSRVSTSAKFVLSREAFPFELGWVFVMPSARGAKLSLPLCALLVAWAGTGGIFATSRTSNAGMHATLAKLGFLRVGEEWQSKQVKEALCLFVRNAA
jgi:hypothetical protein